MRKCGTKKGNLYICICVLILEYGVHLILASKFQFDINAFSQDRKDISEENLDNLLPQLWFQGSPEQLESWLQQNRYKSGVNGIKWVDKHLKT